MSPTAQLQALAQSIYLVIKNRYFDDITGADGQTYISQVIDWTNMWLDELETETTPDGEPINWKWVMQMATTLATATEGMTTFDLSSSINNLLTDENRYVQILQDGTPVSNWAVVAPGQISSQTNRITEDMVTSLGGTVIFSRSLKDTEDGGTVVGDVTLPIPRLSATNVKALSLIKPKTLLILGVAKNATLPDIVQGGLSPSYTQKYTDLLNGAIARNEASSRGSAVQYDDFSTISGVGF